MLGWKSWRDAFGEETQERLELDTSKLCSYGIKALDDPLVCIRNNELVVIGADSGNGKSEIGLHIARTNAQKGRRVAVFYLEGGYREAISRMKWKDMCKIYYQSYLDELIEMDYSKWVCNRDIVPLHVKLEGEVKVEYEKTYKDNILFYDSPQGLTVESFLTSLIDLDDLKSVNGEGLSPTFGDSLIPIWKSGKPNIDLIILDHIQYFNLDKDENEISEITRIIRAVKNMTDKYHIPIVALSHFKKKNKDRGMPDQEDFYGSSNIPKISTTAITMMPATDKSDLANQIYPTYFRIAKCRVGIRPTIALMSDFHLKERIYSGEYQIFKIDSHGGISNEPLKDHELPPWATGTRRNKSEIRERDRVGN